jgi:hypothetical protein
VDNARQENVPQDIKKLKEIHFRPYNDMQRWFCTIANAMEFRFFITLTLPPSTSFDQAHQLLNRYFRKLQDAPKIKQGLRSIGIMVQGHPHKHAHLMVQLKNQTQEQDALADIIPIIRTLQHWWKPYGEQGDANVQAIHDRWATARYLTLPRNLKLHEVNGRPLYQLYTWPKRQMEDAINKIFATTKETNPNDA